MHNMTFEQFKEDILNKVQEKIGDQAEIVLSENVKPNVGTLTGLLFKNNSNMYPTIYLDGFFEEYMADTMDTDSIVKEIMGKYENEKQVSFILNFGDYNQIKPCLTYKLVNFDKNEKMLEDSIYEKVLDLAKIVYVYVGKGDDGYFTARVTKNHTKHWGISEQEVLKQAALNTPTLFPATCMSMEDIIQSIVDESITELPELDSIGDSNMFVITSTIKTFGAAAILYDELLKNLAKLLNDNLIVMPSSVHEMIVIRGSEIDINVVKEMVKTINQEVLSVDDWLSDSVYLYDRVLDEIKVYN